MTPPWVETLKLLSRDGQGLRLTYEQWEEFRKAQEASESFNRRLSMNSVRPVTVGERRSNILTSLSDLEDALVLVEKEVSDLGSRIASVLSPELVVPAGTGRAPEAGVPSPPKSGLALRVDDASNRLRGLSEMLAKLNSRIEL